MFRCPSRQLGRGLGALRVSPAAAPVPLRHIEQLWKGSYLDPDITGREKEANATTGDAWPGCLLRLKSFDDLHKLWYICLKEKNLLLGEKWAAWQQRAKHQQKERLWKVRLSMSRILTVLTQREIHEQCLRAKRILTKQKEREALEMQLFQLEEQMLEIQHKIDRLDVADSVRVEAWRKTLGQFRDDRDRLILRLTPLRKETLQMVAPDWRYHRRYADLPGQMRWRKERVPALLDTVRRRMRMQ
eukprot:GHVT01086261.1.p1 GENE.GHVT01086261.1~~GHVT01086261.1.p1  ORF type:complete len:244 (+),score=23.14 GHVT01086261.1:315-1046(+)